MKQRKPCIESSTRPVSTSSPSDQADAAAPRLSPKIAPDPGPPPINTLFGIGRPKTPPALNKDGRRRAGDYVLGAVRIKAETAARPGDFLNGSDNRLADSWLGTATQPVERDVPMVLGGELMPISEEASFSAAASEGVNDLVTLRNTVQDARFITADASRERIQLAHEAGSLELGLDLADTIQAENSLEKMLVHQLAANHRAMMKLSAQLNRCVENMDQPYRPEAQESANIQGTRLAGAIARMQGAFQSGVLTLQKMRTGGQQVVKVVHQHVTVSGEGAQALVAGEVSAGKPITGRGRKRLGGGSGNGR